MPGDNSGDPWRGALGGGFITDKADQLRQHFLLVLDVSPSMRLRDAGAGGTDSRMDRARAIVESIIAGSNWNPGPRKPKPTALESSGRST